MYGGLANDGLQANDNGNARQNQQRGDFEANIQFHMSVISEGRQVSRLFLFPQKLVE